MSGSRDERAAQPHVAREAMRQYQRQFAAPASEPLAVAWAPGRINLIGEHTDYNEGYVLPAAINRLAALAGRPANEPYATLYSTRHRELARVALTDAAHDDGVTPPPLWARYVLAVWRQLERVGATPPTPGFSAVVHGNVPLGRGLSSSAALEVAAAMFIRALGGAALEPMALARLCQQAEQEGAGVRVGIMDQAASCLGQPHHALLLDCRTLAYTRLPVSLPGAVWVVFDTGAPHTLAASEYNVRRGQCEAAVARLARVLERESAGRSIRALRDVTAGDLARHSSLLDATLLRRARHVVSENERTLRAAEVVRAGDAVAMGDLLNASHASLRDDYAVSGRELDAAIQIAQETPGIFGARMMGAGFGGSIIALARRGAQPALHARLSEEYPRRTGRTGRVLACAITGQVGARQSLVGA